MFMAYSPIKLPIAFSKDSHLLSQRTLQLHPWQAYLDSFSTPWGVFSLEHGVNHRGLRTRTSAITEVA